jgi:NAD(P)-dependent dehydrogenase (short-subunit alcohol dehydrogenase family)
MLALIVGANRGIGLGLVRELLGRGWDVIATARRPDQATALHDLAASHPGRLAIEALQIDDPAQVDAFPARLGGRSLDVAMINAGVAGPEHRSALEATREEIGALMVTNAIAPIRLARRLRSHITEGTGILAFTSSVMGSIADNTAGGHELYRASKAALNSLTRSLAASLGERRITVLTIHPGWVRTDMGGANAPVSVEDSARGIADVLEHERGKGGHRFLDYKGQEVAW